MDVRVQALRRAGFTFVPACGKTPHNCVADSVMQEGVLCAIDHVTTWRRRAHVGRFEVDFVVKLNAGSYTWMVTWRDIGATLRYDKLPYELHLLPLPPRAVLIHADRYESTRPRDEPEWRPGIVLRGTVLWVWVGDVFLLVTRCARYPAHTHIEDFSGGVTMPNTRLAFYYTGFKSFWGLLRRLVWQFEAEVSAALRLPRELCDQILWHVYNPALPAALPPEAFLLPDDPNYAVKRARLVGDAPAAVP